MGNEQAVRKMHWGYGNLDMLKNFMEEKTIKYRGPREAGDVIV